MVHDVAYEAALMDYIIKMRTLSRLIVSLPEDELDTIHKLHRLTTRSDVKQMLTEIGDATSTYKHAVFSHQYTNDSTMILDPMEYSTIKEALEHEYKVARTTRLVEDLVDQSTRRVNRPVTNAIYLVLMALHVDLLITFSNRYALQRLNSYKPDNQPET